MAIARRPCDQQYIAHIVPDEATNTAVSLGRKGWAEFPAGKKRQHASMFMKPLSLSPYAKVGPNRVPSDVRTGCNAVGFVQQSHGGI